MITIIAGSRTITDYNILECVVKDSNFSISEVVCGCAKGVDALGKMYAHNNGIKVTEFPADWEKQGKKAGYLRNKQMSKYSEALIAIWDGESKGTRHMIEIAKENKLKIYVYNIKLDASYYITSM